MLCLRLQRALHRRPLINRMTFPLSPFPSLLLSWTAPSIPRMPYLNSYRPNPPLERADWHVATPPEAYDLNFAFDLPSRSRLEMDGVRLEPVIVRCSDIAAPSAAAAADAGLRVCAYQQPSLHARQLYRLFSAYPDTLRYMPYGPFADFDSFLTFLEDRRRRSNCVMFAVYDLGLEFDDDSGDGAEEEGGLFLRPERIAGVVGLITTPEFRMAELGCVRAHALTLAARLTDRLTD